jgi:glycosyltransferase involved in cell wall biosynthesis
VKRLCPMNVALLTAHISRRAGGFWESIRHLAGGLLKTGIDASVVGLRDSRASESEIAALDELSAIACRVIGPDAFGFSRELLPALCHVGPDLVHAQGIWMYPSLASLRWHRQSRRPYMVSPRGMLDSWALSRALLKKKVAASWFEREHLRSASCLHALNEAEAKAIRAQGLVNPICIVPNGIQTPPASPASRPAWAEYLAPGAKVLLYLGRLHPKKGLVALITAWKRVQADAERDGWCLIIAGWDQGGHAQELSALIRDLGLGRTVRLVGPQFDLGKDGTFRAAAVFVLPSLSEGLPVGVLEAWSYGLPVLMTPQCNLPEGFAAGAALRTEPDARSLAEALRQLLTMSGADRRAMGDRGRALVRERFQWSEIAQQMRSVYEWILGGGPAPASVLTD